MTDPLLQELLAEFIEKGAALEHERWAKWQNYLHSFLTWNNELHAWVLPHEKKEQWQRQIRTPYSMLSEAEKESDRKETRNYLTLLTSAVLRTRESVVDEAVSVVPQERISMLNNMADYDKIKGFNRCRAATLEALTALKETNPSTP